MTGLEDAYAQWRRQPFPSGSSVDGVDELHADLALADTWVADTVIPFVEHGLYQRPQIDVIDELRRLRARALELEQAVEGDEKHLAQDYREYAELLLGVYEELLAAVR